MKIYLHQGWWGELYVHPLPLSLLAFSDRISELLCSNLSTNSLLLYNSGAAKELGKGKNVFHTGTATEEPDSSSSEESDIECKLTSDEESSRKEEPKSPKLKVIFSVSPQSDDIS